MCVVWTLTAFHILTQKVASLNVVGNSTSLIWLTPKLGHSVKAKVFVEFHNRSQDQ